MSMALPAQTFPRTAAGLEPPDLGAAGDRERLSGPALRAFFNIMARWRVKDADARMLLGGVTNGPYYDMKRKPDRVLEVDRLTRISLLVGIFKALRGAPFRQRRRSMAPHAQLEPHLRRRYAAGLHAAGRPARAPDGAPAR
jgi:hypothetical protein